ncbi:MAG: M14 family metallopeptidase [Halofilum sp. (in: g-proteobacteria)]
MDDRSEVLHEYDALPPGLIETPSARLHEVLPGPSLIRLPGERPEALFVSVLQHGNEDTGLRAVQQLLADYGDRPLPRPLTLFVGNVAAAAHGQRRLDHQPDFNRCWPGTDLMDAPETRLMARVAARVGEQPLFASIDIHNTTGENPHHACINVLDPDCLQLARLFGRTVLYFTRPHGVQPQAFIGRCPAVLLECGRPGQSFGVAHARDYLEHCLQLAAIPDGALEPIDFFHSVALVEVRPEVSFRFGEGTDAELALDPELDHMNFRELQPGTSLGHVRSEHLPVQATDPAGFDVSADYFEIAGGELRLRRAVMPSLLTREPRIVRQDCLCHLLERYQVPTV